MLLKKQLRSYGRKKMIRIRNEADFARWFRKNYKKIGFNAIIKDNKDRFPDFIMLEGDKEVRVELEIKSSNFLLHKHPISEVDKILCIKKDIELSIPIVELKNFKIIAFDEYTTYDLRHEIYKLFNYEKVLTTNEVSKKLNIVWNTADSYLKDLVIEGKLERIKKEGVNLWMIK